ncbi:hypothetical protein [Streptomyces sp. NBC_00203]|uniref:hypothetical protein n=1 Tax=Streptomyces sp. NBC_00203 TaxID=2975680 RepID=UPI00324D5AF8
MALTLTACQPGETDDTGAAGSSASPSATASAGATATASPAASASADNGSCPTIAKGHKVIWVNNVEGAMNNVIAKDAKMHCDPKSDAGAAYEPVGEVKTYSMASGDTKVTVISKNDMKQKALTAQDGGIAHVKTCADPNGTSYDGGQASADTSDCWGMNFYDVAVGADNKITAMTEVYSS